MAKKMAKYDCRKLYDQFLILSLSKRRPEKVWETAELSGYLKRPYGSVIGLLFTLRIRGKLKRIDWNKYISSYHPDFDKYEDTETNGGRFSLLDYLRNTTQVSIESLQLKLKMTRKEVASEISRMLDVGMVERTAEGKYRLADRELVEELL